MPPPLHSTWKFSNGKKNHSSDPAGADHFHWPVTRFETGFAMAELASIPADRLMPASVDPGPAGYPPVKVRAAAADLLPTRSLYHQETQSLVRDFLTYDEIPGVTNCSTANLPAGFRIERHVHPSKVSPFFPHPPTRTRPDDLASQP